jgi:hypothetical protein
MNTNKIQPDTEDSLSLSLIDPVLLQAKFHRAITCFKTLVGIALLTADLLPAAMAHEDFSKKYRYHYISFANAKYPPGYFKFEPVKIDDLGRVYGIAWNNDSGSAATYKNGVVTRYQDQLHNFNDVNIRGTLAGAIMNFDNADFVNTFPQLQAAFVRKGKVEAIPYLAGETETRVTSINDYEAALINDVSTDRYRLFDNGRILVDFKHIPAAPVEKGSFWEVNNKKVVGGSTIGLKSNIIRAVRFQPPYYKPQLLAPLSGDTHSYFYGLNNSGNILGVSEKVITIIDSRYRYGIWDRQGHFKTYYTTNRNHVIPRFNDSNLVVLSDGEYPFYKTYLIPRPGVQLKIENLLDNPKEVVNPMVGILGINNRGDMIGVAARCTADFCLFDNYFFLKRHPVKPANCPKR